MKLSKVQIFLPLLLLFFLALSAQQSISYTDELFRFERAKALYGHSQYAAAQSLFRSIIRTDPPEEIAAECDYYIANCAVRLDRQNAGELIEAFVAKHPSSVKRDQAYLDAANYYFDNARFSYALKWFNKTDPSMVNPNDRDIYFFKVGYTNFAAKKYSQAESAFKKIMQSSEYGNQASYYVGYIAYENENYAEASSQFSKIENDPNYKQKLNYFEADMNFKLGNFQKAIDLAVSQLPRSTPVEKSELSKIIGESYFNLKQYGPAIPYLNGYKGKNRKFSNTDWYQLGFAYFKQNDYENAINQFNKIIEGKNAVAQNAYYHLAQAYLKLDKKQEARNAFQSASNMNFNPKIREESTLNYAKLSYDIGNIYQNVQQVLADFINQYPKHPETKEMELLLLDSYVTSKNYVDALNFLKKNNKAETRVVYQKVTFLHGVELFNENKLPQAYELFNQSIGESRDPVYLARAVFWKAESDYLNRKWDAALDGYLKFSVLPQANLTPEFNNIYYQIGYAYFQLKNYENAAENLLKYLSQSGLDADKKGDAHLRLGDSYYAITKYWLALEQYNQAIALNIPDTDVAEFHKALSYGLLDRNDSKIESLLKIINSYPKSVLRDDAMYELGNIYLNTKQTDSAIETYDLLISGYRMSSYVPKAMLKKALIYFNNQQNEKAIAVYKKIATDFPNTPEAQQAVSGARLAYVELGRGAEYTDWAKTLNFVNLSDMEIENTLFESAEKRFADQNYPKAMDAYASYLSRFPNGIHALRANARLADYFYEKKEFLKSVPFFQNIINKGQNEFTEDALAKLSKGYLEQSDWSKALENLKKLETSAQTSDNIIFAQANIMKAAMSLGNTQEALNYANKVLENSKADANAKTDAKILLARNAFATGKDDLAKKYFTELENSKSGSVASEALYVAAFYKNKDKQYEASNKLIQKLAKDYAGYKETGVKGLILMAKNFDALNDAFQATFILENVIQNFADYPVAVNEAKSLLDSIKKKEEERNSSIENEKN